MDLHELIQVPGQLDAAVTSLKDVPDHRQREPLHAMNILTRTRCISQKHRYLPLRCLQMRPPQEPYTKAALKSCDAVPCH